MDIVFICPRCRQIVQSGGGKWYVPFSFELIPAVKFSPEQIKAFTEDHEIYLTFRKAIESELVFMGVRC
jgi:hypothetical protein